MLLAGGQPRNGTSMLMRVLEFGGVEVEHTNEKNTKLNQARFRNYYGFYETHNPSKTKTFKVFHARVLAQFPDARFIFIYRDIEQAYKSWQAVGMKRDINVLRKMREEFLEELEKHEHIKINCDDLLNNTMVECIRIKEFLNGEFDVDKAVLAVDKTLLKIR